MTVEDRRTIVHTIRLDPDADKHLRFLCPRRTGMGAVISRLILEHKLRDELAHQPLVSREDWEATGCNVD